MRLVVCGIAVQVALVVRLIQQWLENPCGATHSRLVREMAAFNEALDDMGLPRQPFYPEPDGVLEDNFCVHPELKNALLMAASAQAVAA